MDKSNNPMVFITGSPGMGKSAFLAHFPESEAYKAYLSQLEGPAATSGAPPIVAPLTFSSEMGYGLSQGDKFPMLGLRMLYGAAVSMASPGSKVPSWEAFAEDFRQSSSAFLNVDDAAKVLRQVYGQERRLLVLVDDIRKAQPGDSNSDSDSDSKRNMMITLLRKLGNLQASDGMSDVLVSSLTARYISDLLGASYWQQIFVVLTPLPHRGLGDSETQRWSAELVQRASQEGRSVDASVAKLLRSTHLLCSGHPSTVERLVRSYQRPDDWSRISMLLTGDPKKKCSAAKLLPDLASTVAAVTQLDDVRIDSATLEYVLSAGVVSEDDLCSYMLERPGYAFLVSVRSESGEIEKRRYQVSMVLAEFLSVMKCDNPDSLPPVGKVAWELFRPLLHLSSEAKLGTWFKRSVALTTVVRSIDRLEIVIKDLELPSLTLQIASTEAELREALVNKDDKDVLIVPPESNQGFDMVVVGKKRAEGVRHYLHCEAAESSRHSDAQRVARCILNTVQRHMELLEQLPSEHKTSSPAGEDAEANRQHEQLAKIKIVFFSWAPEELRLSADDVKRELNAIICGKDKAYEAEDGNYNPNETKQEEGANHKEKKTQKKAMLRSCQKMAVAFVDSHFDSSFRSLSGGSLRRWMLPVLRPVPDLIHAVMDVDEEAE
eukprot:gene29467-35567_t